jgi:hypothetical protein
MWEMVAFFNKRNRKNKYPLILASALYLSAIHPSASLADTVTDWNMASVDIIAEQIKGPAMANRAVALVQTSVYAAVNSITGKYPATDPVIEAPAGASVDAAVAAANHQVLGQLFPKAEAAIDELYAKSLAEMADDQSRADGITVGRKAAEAVFAMRADDKVEVAESYRPLTTPGAYVPTVTPVASTWSDNRLPWTLTSADQFRPAPPPSLDSERWAQDYNEIKTVGAHDSDVRTEEQSAAARFWVATSPKVYFPVVQSVTSQPDRDLSRNARLFAITSQAIEDALIAVFDAKYHYGFWRPMTAIRNGDRDDNTATERQADWKPMVKTPMHPEYPCAHCIVSGTVGTALKADLGSEPTPLLSSSSPTDGGATRTWETVDAFMQEVADARVWEGVHYRNSAEVGTEMGRLIAEQVVSAFPTQ